MWAVFGLRKLIAHMLPRKRPYDLNKKVQNSDFTILPRINEPVASIDPQEVSFQKFGTGPSCLLS